ncbi:MAG: hypothetical protein WDK96_01325 [Candidatus Paceibacterota bacterium]|jgi:hypothetical protein
MSQTSQKENSEVKDVYQTYQAVSDQVKEELLLLKEKPDDFQAYFFKIYTEQPERFKRLYFDENGHKPFSVDLEQIMFDLRLAGVIPLDWL